MKGQMTKVPHFTKTGFKKMRMPKKLHQLLLERRNLTDITHEDCHPNDPFYNCQQIVNNVAVPFRNQQRTRKVIKTHNKMKKIGMSGNHKGMICHNT